MSSTIQRDTIPFGPAKIVRGAVTLYSAGDVNVEVATTFADVNSDQYGPGLKNIVDQTISVKFKVQSQWARLTDVYPDALIAPTVMGSRLVTGTATPLVLHGEDSSLLTVLASAQIGLPDFSIGVEKGEFGEITFGGVCTNAKALGASGSLYTYAATGGTYGTPTIPDYAAAGQWSMAWNTDVLSGDLLAATTFRPDLKVEAVKAGQRTLDWRLKGVQFSADVLASIDLTALSALHGDATTFAYGQRNSTAAGDLVFTAASTHTITLKAATLEKSAMNFNMADQRQRPLSFRSTPLTGARIAWTTPS